MKSIAQRIEDELIAQENAGYEDAKKLHESNWSKTKLQRYSKLLDIAITALEDLQYQVGFNRFVKDLKDE